MHNPCTACSQAVSFFAPISMQPKKRLLTSPSRPQSSPAAAAQPVLNFAEQLRAVGISTDDAELDRLAALAGHKGVCDMGDLRGLNEPDVRSSVEHMQLTPTQVNKLLKKLGLRGAICGGPQPAHKKAAGGATAPDHHHLVIVTNHLDHQHHPIHPPPYHVPASLLAAQPQVNIISPTFLPHATSCVQPPPPPCFLLGCSGAGLC